MLTINDLSDIELNCGLSLYIKQKIDYYLNIINNNKINKMFCQICSFYESDSTMIEYSCGHAFHRRCITPNELSLISPRCKVCADGQYYQSNNNNNCNLCDDDCNLCNSGETAYRIRARSHSSEYSDMWDEVNEYRDISATCVGFAFIGAFVCIALLIIS